MRVVTGDAGAVLEGVVCGTAVGGGGEVCGVGVESKRVGGDVS